MLKSKLKGLFVYNSHSTSRSARWWNNLVLGGGDNHAAEVMSRPSRFGTRDK
jgi:hypothetical protein